MEFWCQFLLPPRKKIMCPHSFPRDFSVAPSKEGSIFMPATISLILPMWLDVTNKITVTSTEMINVPVWIGLTAYLSIPMGIYTRWSRPKFNSSVESNTSNPSWPRKNHCWPTHLGNSICYYKPLRLGAVCYTVWPQWQLSHKSKKYNYGKVSLSMD